MPVPQPTPAPAPVRSVLLQPPQSVLRAVLVALVLEVVLFGAVLRFTPEAAAVAGVPKRVRIAMIAPKPKPPAPKPPPPPPPPKPAPPPPPPPPTPKPEAPKPPPPKPPPPKPVPVKPPPPKPRPAPPKPVPPQTHVDPPAPKVVPALSSAAVASAVMRYAALLNGRVQAGLTVPDSVRMMGLSGKTMLRLTVAPDGTLESVSVAASSGIPPIDRAALAAVRTTRLPAFLDTMPNHPVTFTLTVRLRN